MTLKLTPKQLMLIIMSVLLVLTVTMSAIVVTKVGDMVKGLGGPSVNQPATPGPKPSETDAPTKPTETEPAVTPFICAAVERMTFVISTMPEAISTAKRNCLKLPAERSAIARLPASAAVLWIPGKCSMRWSMTMSWWRSRS